MLKLRQLLTVVVVFLGLERLAAENLPGNLTNGLIVSLPFAGSGTDDSGNGHDAQILGATFTTDEYNTANSAIHFDDVNAERAIVPYTPGLHASYMTVCAWIRTAVNTADLQIAIKGRYPDGAGEEWSFYIERAIYPAPIVGFSIKRNSNGAIGAGWYNTFANTYLTLTNQWLFVAATWDGSTSRIYLNGQPDGVNSGIPAGPIDTVAGGDLTIGRSTFVDFSFRGDVSKLKLYNRALSADELQSLYALEVPGGNTPPVITSSPANLTVYPGAAATFGVNASSYSPISYQWSFNGTNLPTATQSTLVVSKVDASLAGTYTVVVCNSIGCTTNSAFLALGQRPTNGLVVSIPFAGNGNDVSGGGNKAQVFGATYGTDQFGATNSALHVEDVNQERAVIPYSPSLYTPFMTVACWVRTPVNSQAVQIAVKGRYPDSVGEQWSLFYDSFQGHSLDFAIKRNGGGNNVPGWYYAWGDKPLDHHNQWQFVAATWDGTNALLYVDGEAIGTQGTIPPGPIDDVPFGDIVIGRSTVADYSVSGDVDRFKVFDHALTAGEIHAIYEDESPRTAPSIVSPPAGVVTVAGSSPTFKIVADGPGPFTYQWAFGGTNLDGATNASFTLHSVSRASAGNYSVTVCNPFGCTNSTADLVVNPGPAIVSLGNVTAQSPGPVLIPVTVIGNGVENALSFSIRFDPHLLTFTDATPSSGITNAQVLLNASRASNGVVGIAVALPAGVTLPEGVSEIVDLTFSAALLTAPASSQVLFWDQPVVRSIVNVGATNLTASWNNGLVNLNAADFEGDVFPRPNGDKHLTLSDWVQLGRFVAGLDDIGVGTEFQRADCAPLATGGNGVLSVSDWVQAGRYAVGIDPNAPIAGPTNAVAVTPGMIHPVIKSGSPRTLQLVPSANLAAGATAVSVSLDSDGNENAVGFSLKFDPTKLYLLNAKVGTNAAGATVNINTKQLNLGRMGVALALRTGSSFPVGRLDLVQLRFLQLSPGTDSPTLDFSDSPVVREISNPAANPVPVTFINATFTNIAPALQFAVAPGKGDVLSFSWLAELSNALLETSHDSPAGPWSPVTNSVPVVGTYRAFSIKTDTEAPNVGYYRLRLQ